MMVLVISKYLLRSSNQVTKVKYFYFVVFGYNEQGGTFVAEQSMQYLQHILQTKTCYIYLTNALFNIIELISCKI